MGSYWGVVLARITLLVLLLGVLIWIIRKTSARFENGILFKDLILCFPLMTLGSLYFGKFIPDTLAVVLVLVAVVTSWTDPKPRSSFFCCSLGLLIKPTSVLVLGLLFFRPTKQIKKRDWWILAGLLVGAAYYLVFIPYLLKYQDSPFPFQVNPKNPLLAFWEFVKSYQKLFYVFGRFLFTQTGLVLIVIGYFLFWRRFSKVHWRLWLLLLVQFLGIGFLDGAHSFDHSYYFLGLLPTLLLITLEYLNVLKSCFAFGFPSKALYFGLLLVLLTTCIRHIGQELQLIEPTPFFVSHYSNSCQKLRERNPHFPWNQGYVFRSPLEQFPQLGLCFLERSGSHQSNFGFFDAKPLPNDCKLVDQMGDIYLATCGLP